MIDAIERLNGKGVFTAILAVCLLFATCGHRSTKKEVSRVRTEVDSLQSLVDGMYTAREMDARMRISSLEQEKSTLFNLNYIVLTKQRPDFRMNAIDREIDSLKTRLQVK